MSFIVVTPTGDTVDSSYVAPEVVDQSYLVTLEGSDGSTWDLNAGKVQLLAGAKLFNTGDITHWWRSSPKIAGARYVGSKTPMKTLSLPVATTGVDWADWRDVDTAFFRALAPEEEATLVVTAPDAVTRSMRIRLASDGDVEDDFDPLIHHRKEYILEVVAASPFWEGDPIVKSFEVGDPVPWLEPSGYIYLNPPTTTAEATMPNPGDVEAWWEADIVAPFDSFKVGVGDAVVSTTANFAAGSSVQVLSDPRRRIVLDDAGNRINPLMDNVAFDPVPPGREVPMTLAVTGNGPDTDVTVTLIPLYRRPI